MIDLHCHILPGIDDGPATIADSVALARAAAAAGTRTILATSHVNWHYRNQPETLRRLTAEVNERLRTEEIELEVRPGAEVAMTYAIEVEPASLAQFGLGGGPWVLIEPPFSPVVRNLDLLLVNLQQAGLRVVLAHPERCPAFHRDPEMLQSLVDCGVVTSITAGALVGRFGSEVRRFSFELIQRGLVHNVASDAHDHTRRPPGIRRELEQAGLAPLAGWLTEEVPAAILSGETIPPRPQVALPSQRTGAQRRWLGKLKRAL